MEKKSHRPKTNRPFTSRVAYGVGIRHMDKTGEPYEAGCEIDGYNIVCNANCSGEEERCLVYRALSEGMLKFICIGE